MAVKGKGKQIAGKVPASSASSSGKRKSTRVDGESSSAPPKKKRSGVSHFVEDAAVDADYEGEEEEEEDDLEWEIDEDFDFGMMLHFFRVLPHAFFKSPAIYFILFYIL